MTTPAPIPVFTLFGETDHFPDVVHCEPIADRAPTHGWAISAHRHAQMAQLFYIQDGAVSAKVDGRQLRLESGDFLYISAQSVHEFLFAPDTTGMVVSFPMSIVNTIGPASPDMARVLSRPFAGRGHDTLQSLVIMLAETRAGIGTFRTQAAVSLAHAILVQLAEIVTADARVQSPPASARLEQFDTLITAHLGDNWGVADFAAAMSISAGHLNRMCRASTGISASAYIEQITMEEASRLLAFTKLSVAQVGYRLGYNDPSYFSKRFRSARGQTPTRYRSKFI